MIVDFIVGLLVDLVEWVAGLLPVHEVSAADPGPILGTVAELDSLVPIAGPLTAAMVVLGFVVAFVAVRLVLMVRHVLLP